MAINAVNIAIVVGVEQYPVEFLRRLSQQLVNIIDI
jgi:hypothetical protein